MLHLVEDAGLLVVVRGLSSSVRLFSEGWEPTFMRVPINAGLAIGILAQVVYVVEVLGLFLPPRILGVFVVIIGLEITVLLFCLLILFCSRSSEP